MPDSHDRTEKSDADNAQEKMRAALERSVAEIKTPDQARHTFDFEGCRQKSSSVKASVRQRSSRSRSVASRTKFFSLFIVGRPLNCGVFAAQGVRTPPHPIVK
jgi:hypothetical protein